MKNATFFKTTFFLSQHSNNNNNTNTNTRAGANSCNASPVRKRINSLDFAENSSNFHNKLIPFEAAKHDAFATSKIHKRAS